jgi:hypothetical protein
MQVATHSLVSPHICPADPHPLVYMVGDTYSARRSSTRWLLCYLPLSAPCVHWSHLPVSQPPVSYERCSLLLCSGRLQLACPALAAHQHPLLQRLARSCLQQQHKQQQHTHVFKTCRPSNYSMTCVKLAGSMKLAAHTGSACLQQQAAGTHMQK